MKLKNLALVLAIVLLAGVAVPGLASANPFADVPANHWAYDAISELAAVGLVEGYPDGTYGGARMLTRYEAAMVFARTLARLEALVDAEVAASTAGVQKNITAEVLKDIEAAKASLVDLIKAELAAIEIPVVEKTIVEKPAVIETIERPFEVTPEVEAILAELVGDLAKQYLADAEAAAKTTVLETKIIERVSENALTAEDVEKIAEELLVYHLGEYDVLIDRALRENINQDRKVAALEEAINGRLRKLEMGQEALEGDIAYTEHRLLGLVDGIRNDVNGLQANLDEAIAQLSTDIAALSDEFNNELALLGIRVDELELLVADMDSRIAFTYNKLTGVEGRVAGLEGQTEAMDEHINAVEAKVDRVTLDGTLKLNATNNSATETSLLGTEYKTGDNGLKQTYALNLNVKASDTVNVKAFATGEAKAYKVEEFTPKTFGLVITSETPIKRLVAGSLDEDELKARFSNYVLNARPGFGGLADVEIAGLEANLLGSEQKLGASLNYEFAPAFGLKAAYTAHTQYGERKTGNKVIVEGKEVDEYVAVEGSALLGGIYGKVLGVTYDAVYGLDRQVKDAEKNSVIDLKLSGDLGPVSLSANWGKAEENFGTLAGGLVNDGLIHDDAETKLGLGASAEFLGIDLAADYYNEKDAAKTDVVKATKFSAEQEFELFVPITLSGTIAKESITDNNHKKLEIGVSDLAVFGSDLTFGTSFAMITNRLEKDGTWKDAADYTGTDVNVIKANVGYEFGMSGADVNLGYAFQLAIPRGETKKANSNETTHTLTAGYDFTENLGLTFSAERFAIAGREESGDLEDITAKKVNQVKAGLEFKF